MTRCILVPLFAGVLAAQYPQEVKSPEAGPADEPALEVTVVVYEDRDRDGTRAADEGPMSGVVVSDQVSVARTGAGGEASFRCRASATRFVYASIPETCSLRSPAWVRIPHSAAGKPPPALPVRLPIGLWPLDASEVQERASGAWTFVQTSDIHVAKPEDAVTFQEDLGAIASLNPRPLFVAATGDLVNVGERVGEYRNYVKGLEGARVPHFSIIGNHDVDKTPSRVSNYEAHLGPRNFSWNVPGFRGIAVDSVHYDAAQEAWLIAELRSLEPGRRALVFQHYLPGEKFLATLAQHPVAAVFSGHWHGQRLRRYGDILDVNTSPLRFGGIDRSPRGFRVVTVAKDGGLTTEFRVGGVVKHRAIVAPAEGDAARDGRIAVVVAFYDTSTPATEAVAHVEGPGPATGPAKGHPPGFEHEHGPLPDGHESDHVHLQPQGEWLWVGHYEPTRPLGPMRLNADVDAAGEDGWQTGNSTLRLRPGAPPRCDGAFAQHRGSALKTGAVAADVSFKDGLSLLWTARAGAGNLSSPVVAGDRVVVAAPAEHLPEDAGLACFHAPTGRLLWRAPTSGSVVHAAAIDGDRVVAVTQTGQVHGFALADGEPCFATVLGKPNLRWDVSAPAVRDGIAWLGTGLGFGALDLKTGQFLWTRGTEEKPPEPWSATDWWPNTYQSPAVSGPYVAFGHRKALMVLDAASGRTLWSAPSKQVNNLPAFDAAGTELWAIVDRRLGSWKRAADDGSAWEAAVTIADDLGDTTTTPAVAADRVIVAAGSGSIRAYARSDGKLLWSHQVAAGLTSQRPYARGEPHVSGSPLVVGNAVVAGATDGVLRVLDLASGAVVCARDLGVPLTGSPAFAGNVLYVPAWDGQLFAFVPALPAGPEVIAHRGGSLEAPENTLAAFRAARALGVDWIELDVRLSKDGVPVVIHDQTLGRTAGTKDARPVGALTLEEIRRADVGAAFKPECAGERVPALADVLGLPPGAVRIMIELKAEEPSAPGILSEADGRLAETVVEAVRNGHAEHRVAFASFSPFLLRAAHRLLPQVPLIAIAGTEDQVGAHFALGSPRYEPFYEALPLEILAVDQKLATPALLADVRARGLKLWAWTAKTDEEIQRLRDLGVDGIITDTPSRAR